jgi:hypothetical protein
LTFDDIVARAPFPVGPDGGRDLALSFDAAFTDDIAFHPDFSIPLTQHYPAIRRSGGKLQLGGLRYGSSEVWGTFGSFNGQTLSSDFVHIKLYTRGGNQVAIRVIDGDKTYDSGFVTFPQALGALQLVGANTNGSNGAVTLSGISGGVAYSDAMLDALRAR